MKESTQSKSNGDHLSRGFSVFDEECEPKLRNQILFYQMAELMTDLERAKFFGLPEGCRIRERAKILAPEKFVCGSHVWIGEGAVLDAQGGLQVGDYTQIGLGVMVWSHSSHLQALDSKTGKDKRRMIYQPTSIGASCFIAGPSVIQAGVTIGDKVIVPPFSLVDQDIASNSVFGGSKQVQKLEQRIVELEKLVKSLRRD